MILVDTNVLMDVVIDDPCGPGGRSSSLTLRQLAINEIVYAEQSIGYERMEELDAMIHSAGLVNALISRPAPFLAGKAFQRYRSADGLKTGMLSDFFIGAHSAVTGAVLFTRDASRYRSYLPGIILVAPN